MYIKGISRKIPAVLQLFFEFDNLIARKCLKIRVVMMEVIDDVFGPTIVRSYVTQNSSVLLYI